MFVNFAFLFFVIFSIVTYNLCLSKQSAIYAYPMLSYQVCFDFFQPRKFSILQLVTMFWLLIWLYAALNSVASGVMWSLESLGGPSWVPDSETYFAKLWFRTSRIRTSHNIRDANYANPNETHPETARGEIVKVDEQLLTELLPAIKYGSIIGGLCVLIISLKMVAFVVARRTYFQVLKMEHESIEQSVKVVSITERFETRRTEKECDWEI